MLEKEIILIVDDNEDDLLLIQRAFKKAGLGDRVRVAHDGDEAIRYLSGEGAFANRQKYPLPFLVLLDLKMPGVDGFEVLQWARAEADLKRLLFVVLTSSNLQTDVDHAYELGANSYLVKPVEFDEMVNLVQRFQAYWSEINRTPTAPKVVPSMSLESIPS